MLGRRNGSRLQSALEGLTLSSWDEKVGDGVTVACDEEKAWLCLGRSIGLAWPPPAPRDVVGRAIGQEGREPPPAPFLLPLSCPA